jgi:hypothetical protein
LFKKAIGGAIGQMLLRFLGCDGFVATKDLSACLRDAGLYITAAPTSKRDLARIQEPFNAWAKETGLPYRHLSLIFAMSIIAGFVAGSSGELYVRPWPCSFGHASRISEC